MQNVSKTNRCYTASAKWNHSWAQTVLNLASRKEATMTIKARILPLAILALASASGALPRAALARTKAVRHSKAGKQLRGIRLARRSAVAGQVRLKGNTRRRCSAGGGGLYRQEIWDERKSRITQARSSGDNYCRRKRDEYAAANIQAYQRQRHYKDGQKSRVPCTTRSKP